MKREVIDCDVCKKETKLPIHIAIPNGTDYHFDGVESNYDYIWVHKDLCPACAENLFKFMFGHTKKGAPAEPAVWEHSRYRHASAITNDTVELALKFFKIDPRR